MSLLLKLNKAIFENAPTLLISYYDAIDIFNFFFWVVTFTYSQSNAIKPSKRVLIFKKKCITLFPVLKLHFCNVNKRFTKWRTFTCPAKGSAGQSRQVPDVWHGHPKLLMRISGTLLAVSLLLYSISNSPPSFWLNKKQLRIAVPRKESLSKSFALANSSAIRRRTQTLRLLSSFSSAVANFASLRKYLVLKLSWV